MTQEENLNKKYRVVLTGDIRLGYNRDEVLDNLAQLFKTTVERVEQYIAGDMHALNKHYEQAQAEKIVDLIMQAGAKASVMTHEKWQQTTAEQNHDAAHADTDDASDEYEHEQELHQDEESADAGQWQQTQQQKQHEQKEKHEAPNNAPEDDFSKGTAKDAMAQFVQKNYTQYYARRFDSIESSANQTFKASWHWPAFFAFFFWACYRKMWLPALGYLIIVVLVNYFLMSDLAYIMVKAAAGMSANYLYYRHAKKHIAKYQGNTVYLERVGGVSTLSLVASVMFMFFLTNYIGNIYLQRIYDNNKDEFAMFTSDTGNQLKGDQPLASVVNLNEQEWQTSEALKRSAIRVKMFELMMQGQADANALNMVPLELDAWGNPIVLKRQDQQLMLQSLGLDGQVNTQDDLFQPYNLKK